MKRLYLTTMRKTNIIVHWSRLVKERPDGKDDTATKGDWAVCDWKQAMRLSWGDFLLVCKRVAWLFNCFRSVQVYILLFGLHHSLCDVKSFFFSSKSIFFPFALIFILGLQKYQCLILIMHSDTWVIYYVKLTQKRLILFIPPHRSF